MDLIVSVPEFTYFLSFFIYLFIFSLQHLPFDT